MDSPMWHVSSSLNRASIEEFGLDWTRMGAARGIAGSHRPENEGVFVSADLFGAYWFCEMNNTGGPVDVWAVNGVDPDDLLDNGNGYFYVPTRVARFDIELRYADVLIPRRGAGAFVLDDLEREFEQFRHHADPRVARRLRRAARARGRR